MSDSSGPGDQDGRAAGLPTHALAPLARPEPMRVRVESALRELIISRQVQPGEHLTEQDLARRLSVSRQPVREALQALELEGWVDLHVGRGAFVHEPTAKEVDQIFAVRGALEAEAARLACPNIDAAAAEVLTGIIRDGWAALEGSHDDVVVDANARFHLQIAALAGNAVLLGFLEALDQRIRWYFTPLARVRGADSWKEHERILDALHRDEPGRAAELMRQHTENTRAAY